MSIERVPQGVDKILLTLHYQDGFCTVQAIFDTVTIERLVRKGNCVLLYRKQNLEVCVRKAPNSQVLTRILTLKIADQWLAGNYIKVESALIDGLPSIDWMR